MCVLPADQPFIDLEFCLLREKAHKNALTLNSSKTLFYLLVTYEYTESVTSASLYFFPFLLLCLILCFKGCVWVENLIYFRRREILFVLDASMIQLCGMEEYGGEGWMYRCCTIGLLLCMWEIKWEEKVHATVACSVAILLTDNFHQFMVSGKECIKN